ncbi:MAG: hypothetical protein KGH64_01960 [Candidatus Micrarchaeota archaeon]|nr:hypothetical protein [Candidatus Micrarchaeota archaeon]MDE1834081.1 hypothetical protein [Candidatus Micrarchaeota archaeon]MDE1859795.1 hypothetical protein [Candidatus Micrarchaeota archaeon]
MHVLNFTTSTKPKRLLQVASDNVAVGDELARMLRRDSAAPFAPHRSMLAVPHLAHRLTKILTSADLRIKIGYKGGSIGFSFETEGELECTTPVFHSTNEIYTKELEASISSTTGVTDYIGIGGGTDGTLARIGALRANNHVGGVELVDKNMLQMLSNMVMLAQFDNNVEADVRRSPFFGSLSAVGHYPKGHISMELRLSDINEAISGTERGGTYFVYLSNAFSMPLAVRRRGRQTGVRHIAGWSRSEITSDLLANLHANENIHNGSYVMFAAAHDTANIIIRKEAEGFNVHSFDYSLGIDVKAQSKLLESMVG